MGGSLAILCRQALDIGSKGPSDRQGYKALEASKPQRGRFLRATTVAPKANRNRGDSVCANGLRVSRSTVESVLLQDVRRELLAPTAYAAFELEAKEMLSREAPDPTHARRTLAHARKEAENIMNAIRAGIVTPGTKAALEAAEAGVTAATETLAAMGALRADQGPAAYA